MRLFGMILMYGGFLAAAFFSVRRTDAAGMEWQTIEWPAYIGAFFVSLAGVIMVRVTATSAASQAHVIEQDLGTLRVSMDRLVERLAALNRGREDLGVYDVSGRIDGELMDDLGAFADARESLIPRFGLDAYADVMSFFAASERNINRAWSASVDGYIDETYASLSRAEQLMLEAQKRLPVGLPA